MAECRRTTTQTVIQMVDFKVSYIYAIISSDGNYTVINTIYCHISCSVWSHAHRRPYASIDLCTVPHGHEYTRLNDQIAWPIHPRHERGPTLHYNIITRNHINSAANRKYEQDDLKFIWRNWRYTHLMVLCVSLFSKHSCIAGHVFQVTINSGF